MTERLPSEATLKLAKLPTSLGGRGMPNYAQAAPAVFLSAQSRLLPATAALLNLGSSTQILEADPQLAEQIETARELLLEAGCQPMHLPFGPEAPAAKKTTKGMMKPQQKQRAAEIKASLSPPLAARLTGQSASSASTWMQEAFPGGSAQPKATWQTMMRLRLLLSAPGAASEAEATSTSCQLRLASGQACGRALDSDGVHELVCPASGSVEARHTRVKNWLAERIRERWACPAQKEQPVEPPLVKRAGVMDIVAVKDGMTLLIDVVLATSATDNEPERQRRVKEPGRSLRTAEARKFTRYGPSVVAFAVEDTGRLGSGTARLLRALASEQEDVPAAEDFRKLVGELQHMVLSATAVLLQRARGVVPTL